jgi:hypothetical protein
MPKKSKQRRRSNLLKKTETLSNEPIFDQEKLPLQLVESSKNQEIPSFQIKDSIEAEIEINEGEPTIINTVNHSLIPISFNELNNLVKMILKRF